MSDYAVEITSQDEYDGHWIVRYQMTEGAGNGTEPFEVTFYNKDGKQIGFEHIDVTFDDNSGPEPEEFEADVSDKCASISIELYDPTKDPYSGGRDPEAQLPEN